jgi:hypothetical protein
MNKPNKTKRLGDTANMAKISTVRKPEQQGVHSKMSVFFSSGIFSDNFDHFIPFSTHETGS